MVYVLEPGAFTVMKPHRYSPSSIGACATSVAYLEGRKVWDARQEGWQNYPLPPSVATPITTLHLGPLSFSAFFKVEEEEHSP